MDRPASAKRIRDLRHARGLTLEELARRLGVSKESVRLWETGKGLRGPNVLKLAREFGVDPGELFRLDVEEDDGAWDADPYPTRKEFFREHGDQLDLDEADHLRRLRYRGDPGELHWADELLRYRKINARIEAALETKLDRAKELAKERLMESSAWVKHLKKMRWRSDLSVEPARDVLRRRMTWKAEQPTDDESARGTKPKGK